MDQALLVLATIFTCIAAFGAVMMIVYISTTSAKGRRH